MNIGVTAVPQTPTNVSDRATPFAGAARPTAHAQLPGNGPQLLDASGQTIRERPVEVEEKEPSEQEQEAKAEESRMGGAFKHAALLQQLMEEVSSRSGGNPSDHDQAILKALGEASDNQAQLMEAGRQRLKELQTS